MVMRNCGLPLLVQAVRVLVAGGALRLEISYFCIGLVVCR